MKYFVLSILLSTSLPAFAGDVIGNGGGLWACMNSQANLEKGMLVDLFEAREEFGFQTISSSETDPVQLAKERMQALKLSWPEMATTWEPSFSEVLLNYKLVDSELVVTDDALYRIKPHPTYCLTGWQYLQFANFTHLDQILIRKDFWNSSQVAAIDKAALLWHEAIYRWLRTQKSDKDSIRARYIVGVIFADISTESLKEKINKVLGNDSSNTAQPLWMCISKNYVTENLFAGYGRHAKIAFNSALSSCQSQDFADQCAPEVESTCGEIKSAAEIQTCRVQNTLTNMHYTATGRSLLEAQYKATQSCREKVHSFHCDQEHIDCWEN